MKPTPKMGKPAAAPPKKGVQFMVEESSDMSSSEDISRITSEMTESDLSQQITTAGGGNSVVQSILQRDAKYRKKWTDMKKSYKKEQEDKL